MLIKIFFLIILPYLARLLPQNRKTKARKLYPQLWYYVPKKYARALTIQYPHGQFIEVNKKKRMFIQWICGQLTGHEISNTEHGFDNTYFMDCHCRWCDKSILIPKQEIIITDSIFQELINIIANKEKGRIVT